MKIALLRKEKKLTQTDLAEMCDSTQQQIARIEGGIVDPRLSTLRRIAEALKCEISELFYTRDGFISDLQALVDERQLNLKNIKLVQLNTLAARVKNIPTFHPFWEEVVIVKGKVKLRDQ